jgi:hypothetical protein
MLKGIVGLDREGLSDAELSTLGDISVEQMRGRIIMRNAQFSYPLSEAQLADALAGRCAPLKFDYERAQRVA